MAGELMKRREKLTSGITPKKWSADHHLEKLQVTSVWEVENLLTMQSKGNGCSSAEAPVARLTSCERH